MRPLVRCETKKGMSSDARQRLEFTPGEKLEEHVAMRNAITNARSEMPMVEKRVLEAIAMVDSGFVSIWELQETGKWRWHIVKHWAEGRTDEPTHVVLLQSPSGGYERLDMDAVEVLKQIKEWNKDPVGTIAEMLAANAMRKKASMDEMFSESGPVYEFWSRVRTIMRKKAWGSVGSCWSRGIELPWRRA